MHRIRNFSPGLYPSISSTRSSGVPIGSRVHPEQPPPPKQSLVRRLAKNMWSKKQPDSSDAEAWLFESMTSSEAAPNVTLGSILGLVKDVIEEYDLHAALLLIVNLASSSLAEAEVPCAQSVFKKQLAEFVGQHNDALGKPVVDVIQRHINEERQLNRSQEERKSQCWTSEVPRSEGPRTCTAPPRIVVPMRSSLLRLCRGTRSSTPSPGFTGVVSDPGPRNELNGTSRRKSPTNCSKLSPREPYAQVRRPRSPRFREESHGLVHRVQSVTSSENATAIQGTDSGQTEQVEKDRWRTLEGQLPPYRADGQPMEYDRVISASAGPLRRKTGCN